SLGMRVTSWPSKNICPEVTGMAPATRLKKVLLPAPLGPIMALIWLASKLTDTSLTAAKPPNCLTRFLTSSTVALLLFFLLGSNASGFFFGHFTVAPEKEVTH